MEPGIQTKSESKRDLRGGIFVGAFILLALLFQPASQAHASDASYTVTETVETIEYEIVEYETVEPDSRVSGQEYGQYSPQEPALGQYGPFRIMSADTAEMTGTVDSYTPALFRKMLVQFPGIRKIEMLDCDGSVDEEANLNLARLIRRAGINTHVPANGSVRSGAVELFLAGVSNTADPGAEFIVHSWMDEDGMEANDYPAGDPVHREYLDYYVEMGVPADKAPAFYSLTNSVPFSGQLKLSRNDLARYQLLH